MTLLKGSSPKVSFVGIARPICPSMASWTSLVRLCIVPTCTHDSRTPIYDIKSSSKITLTMHPFVLLNWMVSKSHSRPSYLWKVLPGGAMCPNLHNSCMTLGVLQPWNLKGQESLRRGLLAKKQIKLLTLNLNTVWLFSFIADLLLKFQRKWPQNKQPHYCAPGWQFTAH